ncbi:unnamed protein product [Gordionus sp. m RMFG-2023]|uniref:RNA-binding protein 39-like n=1 Tax=Gordionus sp. m RMFG-2023 TaxID=3053472 RepID=UPI0030E19E0B
MADDFIESLIEAPYQPDNADDERMDLSNPEDNGDIDTVNDDKHKRSKKKRKKEKKDIDEDDESKSHKKKDKKHKKKELESDDIDKRDFENNDHKNEKSDHSNNINNKIEEKTHKKDRKREERDVSHSSDDSRKRKRKEKDKSRDRDKKERHRDSSRSNSTKHKRNSSKDRKRKSQSRSTSPRKSQTSSHRNDKYESRKRNYDEEYERRNSGRSRHSPDDSPPPRASDKDDVELTPEERDQRTVLFMQLGPYVNERDIMDFLKSVGKKTKDVRDIRLIVDSRTRKSKGLAYVEFKEPESVQFALGLNGKKIRSRPIVVQHSQAEKNRLAILANGGIGLQRGGQPGPMKLYVGSLHPNISEEMLRGIFEPFGKIDFINLIMDLESNKSRGYGFIQFHDCEDAKRALESLNGFELAGKGMKVSKFNERLGVPSSPPMLMVPPNPLTPLYTGGSVGLTGSGQIVNFAAQQAMGSVNQSAAAYSVLDNEEMEKTGIDLGASGRLQLMAKLAEGTGMLIPKVSSSGMSGVTHPHLLNPMPQIQTQPPIATPCFMLSNMFDPSKEEGSEWIMDIRDDVIEECDKHGGVLHIYIDSTSPAGNVYVKCVSITTAIASVTSLHGRWFAGKMITAAYIPLANYHSLFSDAISAFARLKASSTKE